ncbi:MAG: histidinol-phosphatase [Treponema sp.]|nr:histidinol-phosphatase [Treponema sp.]
MKTNYHMHTTFCDGKNSAQEMAQAAFEKKFDIIGFSSHSMYPFAGDCHIALREFPAYVNAIRSLAKEYDGRMKILCGFEAEYMAGLTVPRMSDYAEFKPDYLIGAVHYIITENGTFAVDASTESVRDGIQKYFNGNAKEAVCTYFALQREMLQKGDFAIWAHPDVIRKRNAALHFFDENESWYRNELVATANCAKHSGVIAEINTGAIARGAMDSLYPSDDFLAILHAAGVPVTISSDAHSTEHIDCCFDRALLAAKKAGYTETLFLEGTVVKSQKI